MRELKKKISNKVKEFADTVIEEADEAEDQGRFFNKGVIGKALNELYHGIDLEFVDAEERLAAKKKRW